MAEMTVEPLDVLVHNILRGIADASLHVTECERSDGRNGLDQWAFISKEKENPNSTPCMKIYRGSIHLDLFPQNYCSGVEPNGRLVLSKTQARDISEAIWVTKEAAHSRALRMALDIIQ